MKCKIHGNEMYKVMDEPFGIWWASKKCLCMHTQNFDKQPEEEDSK